MNTLNSGNQPDIGRIFDLFKLTDDQRRAAAARGQDVVVTAGAGSGKTRTLVARYISLLAEGGSPRRVVAITFTEKAAREMRSRVRSSISEQISLAESAVERQRWSDLEAQIDSARIGTIHSLCSEILRTHPAEAAIDPRFNVVDEGLAATLRAQAVQETLAWLVEEPKFIPLLLNLNTSSIEKLLAFLLDHRLEAQAGFQTAVNPQETLTRAMQTGLVHPLIATPLAELRGLDLSGDLVVDAGDKLADQVTELLSLWQQAVESLASGNWVQAAMHLFTARRTTMSGNAGKKTSLAKASLVRLKDGYDACFAPWLGGKGSKDTPPDPSAEQTFQQCLVLVSEAFAYLLQTYQAALRQRQALDFDDLEAGTAHLLAAPELQKKWQVEVDALLVDEFQDTNIRQREIVLALCGETPGRLFVVGDARQSIYRFRQADVRVFRQLQEDILHRGGLVIDLNRTYRAHTPLLQATGDLLSEVMGDQPDPDRPYFVPYAALASDHDLPRHGMEAPHVEFVLGTGADAESARPAAGRALALRLHELRQGGQIQRWDDVALLFRASTGFPYYEDAFEEAAIPFVTVAGQGFYNRPEIRDVVNLLRALADPWDDLAMAGLLRSPAFGLSDAALFHLRGPSGQTRAFWSALQGDLQGLNEPDLAHARRALAILQTLIPLVDRLPVAELLKRLVDKVDYRAILASTEFTASRLWRNLDKLLADAQASEMVNVRSFLEYLDTLREVGAREGEAPAEAEGAVRLMTIHKAKGLEFPLVILADAARQRRNTGEAIYLLPETGLVFKLDSFESPPLPFRWARSINDQQADAEEKRLLYVALTRAEEKLLISGHSTPTPSGQWKANGWLGELASAGRCNIDTAAGGDQPLEVLTAGGHPLRLWVMPPSGAAIRPAPLPQAPQPSLAARPLYPPLLLPELDTTDPEPDDTLHPWRATGERLRPPADVVGRLVHTAIQHWLFPGQALLTKLLEISALNAGLSDAVQRAEALRLAELLLSRLQHHPLWQEIDQASQRYHEVPYARLVAHRRTDSGYIDLLYRDANGWQIIDFKTDALRNAAERLAAVEQYTPQMRRYAQAAQDLLRERARVRLCFLDDMGRINLLEI